MRNWLSTRDFHPRCQKECWPSIHQLAVCHCMFFTASIERSFQVFEKRHVYFWRRLFQFIWFAGNQPSGFRGKPQASDYHVYGDLYLYTYDVYFPQVSNIRFLEVIWYFPSLVKQSVQDGGFHEMTALSWKLGEAIRSEVSPSTIPSLSEVLTSQLPNKNLCQEQTESDTFTMKFTLSCVRNYLSLTLAVWRSINLWTAHIYISCCCHFRFQGLRCGGFKTCFRNNKFSL